MSQTGRGGNVKKEPRPSPKAKRNGNPGEKHKLLPIEELVRRICRHDHTKGIIVR